MRPSLTLLVTLALATAVRAAGGQVSSGSPASARTDLVHEATIPQLQRDMAAGRVTSVQLVDASLARIAAYDRQGPTLAAMIYINPAARREAAARDAERASGRVRGPLHGIPVVVKDNYATTDMPTTASSMALAGWIPPTDATQIAKLRAAGAVIVGKTNLHELAMGITTVSSLGGQTCNPYDPARNAGGSSGGTAAAVAASFGVVGWGSDTCGSIRIPAASTNLFGLRPTKGLSSIAGIIPLSHTQDVAGPLARTVTDLAIALDATVGPDPRDPATRVLAGAPASFTAALDTGALRGVRIGAYVSYFGSQPEDAEAISIVRAALEQMRARGATVVDVTIPGLDSLVGRAGVIDFEFRDDFRDFMTAAGNAPVTTLAEIIDRRLYHGAIRSVLERRNASPGRDSEGYRVAMARRDSVRARVVSFLDERGVDVLVYPTVRRKPALVGQAQPGATCQLSAVSGLPALAIPAGFTPDSLPIGLELLGRPFSDQRLVAMGFAYEQAVRPRRAPRSTPALPR